MTYNTDIKHIIKNLPASPGVYKFLDSKDNIIYIGKAKSLKKRVSSYFTKEIGSYRINLLVKKIRNIEYIVVESEQDALLLENNLIKEYQPKYNIQLKDDKTFPWICVKNERFPRVFSTRNRIEDGSIYFGPYTSAHMIRTLLDMIRKIYPLRSCNLNLSDENIKNGKFRTCLEYQIENCKGPCEGFQDENDYNDIIDQIKKILKGNLSEVINYLNGLMNEFSLNYQFEKANDVKHKLEILDKFQNKSTIVNPEIKDTDVYSIVSTEKYAVVNYLKIANGAIIQSHTVELNKKLDESDEELLVYAIIDIQQKIPGKSKEIILQKKLKNEFFKQKIVVPKIGDKKKLLDLSIRNAIHYKIDKENTSNKNRENNSEIRLMARMKEDLKLVDLPYHIECFDNSNLQGTNAVSSCVVFRNGKPSKREYRHFNVKTVFGPDDFATMKEVIRRRYSRLLEENSRLPQLIIIDGGKGQLSMAYQELEKLQIEKQIAIIGIAKKLEEIYFPHDPVPVYLDKNSPTLKIIQHARNEAHRFGITHHRLKRGNEMLISELDEIKGIGEKSRILLLKEFKSIDKLRLAKIGDIEKVIGKSKTLKIIDFLNK